MHTSRCHRRYRRAVAFYDCILLQMGAIHLLSAVAICPGI